ncbi:hypothetical protein CEY02_04680 [Bacillus pumilus]|uniref:Uncharacterized protein n=1 Tax=Bacillus pumilus TaxID=1408 RepID=A0A2A5IY81_BACPU|nr:hypothetical protein CEY02_04680 [Bacillus pumilus]
MHETSHIPYITHFFRPIKIISPYHSEICIIYKAFSIEQIRKKTQKKTKLDTIPILFSPKALCQNTKGAVISNRKHHFNEQPSF